MSDSTYASVATFAAVAAVLVVTPGAGAAFLTSTVISHGRRAGYLAALGMVLGAMIYALVAAVGTTVLLKVFPGALRWIAIGGGAFMIGIGLRGIARAWRRSGSGVGQPAEPPGHHTLVTSGVLLVLGNAPVPLFYLVVVPQYAPRTMTPLLGALLLSAVHIFLAGVWMLILTTLVGGIVDVLRRPRVLLALQLLTASVLILFGVQAIRGASG